MWNCCAEIPKQSPRRHQTCCLCARSHIGDGVSDSVESDTAAAAVVSSLITALTSSLAAADAVMQDTATDAGARVG